MNAVVITGADRNLGLEMAREFLKRDWTVYAGRYLMDLPLLDALQAEYPQRLKIVPLDVSSEASVARAAEAVAAETGRIDCT